MGPLTARPGNMALALLGVAARGCAGSGHPLLVGTCLQVAELCVRGLACVGGVQLGEEITSPEGGSPGLTLGLGGRSSGRN